MLFIPPGKSEPMRLQGAYISSEETEKVMEWYAAAARSARSAAVQAVVESRHPREVPRQESEGEGRRRGEAEAGERDTLFRDAAEACIQNQGGSTSLLQRRLGSATAAPRASSTSSTMPASSARPTAASRARS